MFSIRAPVIVPIEEAHKGYNGGITEYQGAILNQFELLSPYDRSWRNRRPTRHMQPEHGSRAVRLDQLQGAAVRPRDCRAQSQAQAGATVLP